MFNNIGKKIKITAKVFCWIGIILSVAGGVGMIVAGFSGMLPQAGSIVTILGGIGTALLGSLLSWVGSFLMVGFGELVENSAEIAASTRQTNYYQWKLLRRGQLLFYRLVFCTKERPQKYAILQNSKNRKLV